jgi:hypothetical protein
MYAVTESFRSAVRDGGQLYTIAEILYGGEVIESNLRVVDGSVTMDRSAVVQRRANVTLAEPVLLPTSPTSPLAPFGAEVRVWRGFRYRDGVEPIPLFTGPIQNSNASGRTYVTQIDALDRAQRVIDAKLMDDYAITAGDNYGTAIQSLLLAGVPTLTFDYTSTAFVTPQLAWSVQQDRWIASQDMARSIGCDLFFDGLGTNVLRTTPSPSASTPLWEIIDGEDGTLCELDLALTRENAYNACVAFSTNASITTQYRAVALDDNPLSPTYFYGGFGQKPRFYGSPLIGSQAQADTAARSILNGDLGVERAIQLAAVPMPALEPGDAIRVRRSGLLDEIHIAESIVVPLGASGTQTIRTRTTTT